MMVQGPDEADGNPVHLLRHPHGERGAVGEKDRATGFVGSCLGRKHVNEVVLIWDCYILVYGK